MNLKGKALWVLVVAYFLLFAATDQIRTPASSQTLEPGIPLLALRATSGYLLQFQAERLLVKVLAFMGSKNPEREPVYGKTLATYFERITRLHPKLYDGYYVAQAYLPWFGPTYVAQTNAMLHKATQELPDRWEFHYFLGFNAFYFQNNNRLAAEHLRTATSLGGPVFLTHLAAKLSAQEGLIRSGLIWLVDLIRHEENESIRKILSKEAMNYRRALAVQQALSQYQKNHGKAPDTLSELVPDFLPSIPKLDQPFSLQYEAGKLRLLRR